MALANAIDAIPTVPDGTTRDVLFPIGTRAQNQRVFNLATLTVERWSSSAWVPDFQTAVAPNGGASVTAYLANNAVFNVLDNGAKGDSTTDDYAAILRTLNAARASTTTKRVYFPGAAGYLTGHNFALDSSYAGITLWGDGGDRSRLLRGFNGDWFDLSAVLNFETHGMVFDGNYGNATGKGFVLSGNCNYPIFSHCRFVGLSDSHIEFGVNSGYNARLIGVQHFIGDGQGDFRATHVNGPDTTATPRAYSACISNGYHTFNGALDTIIAGCFASRYEIDNGCNETCISASIWADQGNFLAGIPISIGGQQTQIVACRIANTIVLIAGSSGTLVGNKQSGSIEGFAPLTDNSGGTWAVFHPAFGADYDWIGQSTLPATIGGEIDAGMPGSDHGDADFTWVPDSSEHTLLWATTLTADRTLTLPTTGVRRGTRLWVVRSATGGSTLTVGAATTLAASQSCLIEFNGSYWQLLNKGSLT